MRVKSIFKRFISNQSGLYLSPNASLSERLAFRKAWPYTQLSKHSRLANYSLVLQLVLDYFGIVFDSDFSDVTDLRSLLYVLESKYSITYLLTEPDGQYSGDSGLALYSYDDGISVNYPSRWFRSKLPSETPNKVIVLTHLLPQSQTSFLALFNRIFNRRYSFLLTIVSVSLLSSMMALIPTYLVEYIFNAIVPEGQIFLMIQIGFFLLSIRIITHAFGLFNQFIGIRLELFLGYKTLSLMFYRLLHLSSSFFQRFSIGDLQQRIGSVQTIRRVLQSSFVSAISSIFAIVLNLVLIYFKSSSFYLLLILLLLSLAGPAIDIISTTFETYFHYKKLVIISLLNDAILEPLKSIPTVRSLKAEDHLFSNYSATRLRLARLEVKLHLIRSFIAGIDVVVSTFIISLFLFAFSSPSLASILFPASKGISANISQGYILLLLSSFTTINSAVRSFSKSFLSLANIYPDVIRLRPLIREASPQTLSQSTHSHSTLTPKVNQLLVSYSQPKDNSLSTFSFNFSQPSIITGNKTECFKFLSYLYGESLYSKEFLNYSRLANGSLLESNDLNNQQFYSCFLVADSLNYSDSVLNNIVDRHYISDHSYLSSCLEVCGFSSDLSDLNVPCSDYLQRFAHQSSFAAQVMICRTLYFQMTPLFIYNWLDPLSTTIRVSILEFCKSHKILLVCYSSSKQVIDLFDMENQCTFPLLIPE